MMNRDTENTAKTLVADGKGILAADETPGTLTRRFDALGIRSRLATPFASVFTEANGNSRRQPCL